MRGTTTRLNRLGASAGSLHLTSRCVRPVGALNGLHVALVGADASPHVTGFAGFTSSLLDLLLQQAGQVSRPLAAAPAAAPELVIAVLPGPGAAGAAAQLADQHDVPLLVVVQGETRPPAEDAGSNGERLAARLESRALRRADGWAVTGESARRRLLRFGVEDARIDRLPYWAHAVRRGPQVEGRRAAVRRFLGWPTGFLVVCPVGADTTGLVAVVAAAHRLADQHSDVHLVLVGQGPRLGALTVSAAGMANVTVAELSAAEYSDALFAADLLLLTEAADRPDGASAGRLAAGMAAGRPTIAAVADSGELSAELARARAAVLTVPADRPQQLADAIGTLRSSPRALAVMTSGAQDYTRAALGPGPAAATLEAIAAATVSRHPGSSRRGRTR